MRFRSACSTSAYTSAKRQGRSDVRNRSNISTASLDKAAYGRLAKASAHFREEGFVTKTLWSMSKRITAGVLEEVDDGATIWLHSLKDFEFAWRGCTHDVPKETKTMYIGRSRTPVRAAPWFIDFCLHLARSLKEYPSVETVASANQWEFADPFMSKARQYCKRCFPKALLDMKVVEGIMTTAVGSKVESTQLRIR